MAQLFSDTIAANTQDDPITVNDNTVVGITSTALIHVYDGSGAYLGEVPQNGAANFIAVSDSLYIKTGAWAATVTVHGDE